LELFSSRNSSPWSPRGACQMIFSLSSVFSLSQTNPRGTSRGCREPIPFVERLTLAQTLTRPALIRCNALEVCRWAPGPAPAVADALATGSGRHVVRSVAGFAPLDKLRPSSPRGVVNPRIVVRGPVRPKLSGDNFGKYGDV